MVFKPFSHVARYSFAKAFPHGYAQSLVAGAQSSYASSTTSFPPLGHHKYSRFGKPGTSQGQNAFQSTSAATVNGSTGSATNIDTGRDGGLDAYYEAWQKHQTSGEHKEWKQFQFKKRIGWKAPLVLPDGKGKEKEELGLRSDALLARGGLERAYSTSAVEDIKKVEKDVSAVSTAAQLNDEVPSKLYHVELQSDLSPNHGTQMPTSFDGASAGSVTDASTMEKNSPKSISAISDDTAATSVSDSIASQSFTDHISTLSGAKRYAEIPAVFEAMLRSNVQPTAKAYHGLLEAAIHLPVAKLQVVPKALDVYSDMLRRKVLPDTATYTTLLELLSNRALDVVNIKKSLEESKARFGSLQGPQSFMLRSQKEEYDILEEDNALLNAVRIFKISIAGHQHPVYSANTYRLLINACAAHGQIDHIIPIYRHMEVHNVAPFATIFAPMIEAFAKSGDLISAVECYNGYKSLAIADDHGKLSIIQRKDSEVYAAVVKAYAICGKANGASKFHGKILDSFTTVTESRSERLQEVQDTVVVKALIQTCLDNGNFAEALKNAEEENLSASSRMQVIRRICVAAADEGHVETAAKAYHYISSNIDESNTETIAMLAMYIRQGDLESAQNLWSTLSTASKPTSALIKPTAMYAVALIERGHVDEGLMQVRQSFSRIRSLLDTGIDRVAITEEMDECIELIGSSLSEKGIFPTAQASMSFIWAMIENGGLVPSITEHLLAGLGPADIAALSLQDLSLALQVEAGIVGSRGLDIAHSSRFAKILETALDSHMPLDNRTMSLVERSLGAISSQRPDLIHKWQVQTGSPSQHEMMPSAKILRSNPIPTPVSSPEDNFDPYAALTDYRGSTLIMEDLERHSSGSSINLLEILVRFKNMRRSGRHPRYIVYGKLITAAAKEGRKDLVHEIHELARSDIPFVPHNRLVRHGWASILDAMTGACLTLSNRAMAEQFHQELLSIGAAPTANTFGLYITTLNASTKTFDEASEAVKIFQRAQSEGVEPSSFLYNVLIGKLAKARRIDDCLRYYTEMRTCNIRPTSVTFGTVINALCRVSDESMAEEMFEEMEQASNYKPRAAPYNSMMQFFINTKHDSAKVLEYYHRMQSKKIQPTMHTYKLLIEAYATLDPINVVAAEAVLSTICASGQHPEAAHYAALIHAKGCALHDMVGARQIFDDVLFNTNVRPQACLYQALIESMSANHCVKDTKAILKDMSARRVEMTPYIANSLIKGWATEQDIAKSKSFYDGIGRDKREPSTYEAMTRAFLAVEDRTGASNVVHEMLSRGYPSAVSGKISDLLGPSISRVNSAVPSTTPELWC
ncbi:MAG: hypothetical protein Q9187_003638 [Circinaria calcarea]